MRGWRCYVWEGQGQPGEGGLGKEEEGKEEERRRRGRGKEEGEEGGGGEGGQEGKVNTAGVRVITFPRGIRPPPNYSLPIFVRQRDNLKYS